VVAVVVVAVAEVAAMLSHENFVPAKMAEDKATV